MKKILIYPCSLIILFLYIMNADAQSVKGESEFVKAGDAHFMEITNYLKDLTQSQNFKTNFRFDKDEVIVI